MNNKTIVRPGQTRVCALLVLIALMAVSLAGCLTEPPSNEGASTINPVNVTHTHYYSYNDTAYLTGIIKNVGTQNLVDVSVQAEGYANNTTYERGSSGPEMGVNSTLLPSETSPFMIKMSPVADGGVNTSHLNQSQVTSTNLKTVTPARNISSNNSKTKASAQPAERYLSYRILPPYYKLSKANPYPLAIANNKTRFFNQTISVSGEVYNGGTERVNSSVVAVAFYGKGGDVLGVFSGRPLGELAPQKTAPFQIDIPQSNFSISSADVTRTDIYAYKLTS